jgi:hypothetical protein
MDGFPWWDIYTVCPAARRLFFATCWQCGEWTVAWLDASTPYTTCPNCGADEVIVAWWRLQSDADTGTSGFASSDVEDFCPAFLLLVNLAPALGLVAIAEGIESPGQLMSLQSFGCDLGQGYLFARPMPADQLTNVLTNGAPEFAPGEAVA